MAAVYAKATGSVDWSQGRSPMDRGEVWDSSAALVMERPELFSSTPL